MCLSTYNVCMLLLGFMHNARVRTFDADYFIGPTLYETDVSTMNIQELRGILEKFSVMEDKLVTRILPTHSAIEP